MQNATPKLELVARQFGLHTLFAGVLVSNTLNAPRAVSLDMVGKVCGNTVVVRLSKHKNELKGRYGESFNDHSLCSFATEEVWKGFKSPVANEFGGVAVVLDNMLFESEMQTKTSRVGVLSVIRQETNLFNIESHAMYRSVDCIETESYFEFSLERDISSATITTLETLVGDSVVSFFRKPLFTQSCGTPYRLSSVMPIHLNKLCSKQYQEIVENGEPTESTKQELQSAGLLVHNDTDFMRYVQNMATREPLFLQKHRRLLTEEEHLRIDEESTAYLNEEMGVL